MLMIVDSPGYHSLEKDCWCLTFRWPQRRSSSLFLTLKMTAIKAVEMSVTNSLSQDYSNLDDLLSLTCISEYYYFFFPSVVILNFCANRAF